MPALSPFRLYLIPATVMLIVLLSAVQATVSTNLAVNNQYLDKLGKEAAESGIAMANECYTVNGDTITWTNATPLKPNTNCVGGELVTCPATATSNLNLNDARCYIMSDSAHKTSFEVGVSLASDFKSEGLVKTLRKTSGTPESEKKYSLKYNAVTTRMF